MPVLVKTLGQGGDIIQRSEDSIWVRRRDLQGIHWKVGAKVAMPYSFKDLATNEIHGFVFELWSLIAQTLNVSYEITEFDDYGRSVDGIHWNGLVRAVQDGVVDISMSPMSYSLSR